MGVAHPVIWKFVSVLQEEETRQSIRYLKLEEGRLRERARNAEDDRRDLEILRLKNRHLRQEIDVFEYINLMAELMPNCDDFKK